jgi:hypothetical protein
MMKHCAIPECQKEFNPKSSNQILGFVPRGYINLSRATSTTCVLSLIAGAWSLTYLSTALSNRSGRRIDIGMRMSLDIGYLCIFVSEFTLCKNLANDCLALIKPICLIGQKSVAVGLASLVKDVDGENFIICGQRESIVRHDVSPYDYDLRGSLIEYTPHGPTAHSNSGKYPSSGLPGSITVSVIFILFVWSTKTQFPLRLVTQILSLNSFFIFLLLWFMCHINYIQYNTSYIQCQVEVKIACL